MIEVFLIFCGFWILYASLYKLARHFWKPRPDEIPFPVQRAMQLDKEKKYFRYTENGRQYIAYEGSEMYDLILKAIKRM